MRTVVMSPTRACAVFALKFRFAATSRGCRRRIVSGITSVETSANSARPSSCHRIARRFRST